MQKYLQWGVTPWLTARANGAAWRWKCMQLGMLFLNVMNYNEFSLLFTYFSSFQINLKGQTFSLSLFTFSFLLWNYKEFSIHYEEGLCRNRNNKHTCFLTHKLTHTHTHCTENYKFYAKIYLHWGYWIYSWLYIILFVLWIFCQQFLNESKRSFSECNEWGAVLGQIWILYEVDHYWRWMFIWMRVNWLFFTEWFVRK